MSQKKFHPRNKHSSRYDFNQLTADSPELNRFLKSNPRGDKTIDFHDPEAVKMLNKALLKHFYQIENWEVPAGYLCPPVPGRADYIHHIADLLAIENNGSVPTGKSITCLDIGVGANCIYPIIGNREYDWSFIGSDIDPIAIESAQRTVDENSVLKNKIELRLQSNINSFLEGILQSGERVDLTICNPPFHASAEEARKGTERKLKNLKTPKSKSDRNRKRKSDDEPMPLNLSGQSNELWCEGGERNFIQNMIRESADFAGNCLWFSTLVSKESNLKFIETTLKKVAAAKTKIIPMNHGNKTSRIVAWTFLTDKQRENWRKMKW